MRKIYAASGNLFTDSWSWQSFVSSCDVFNCLFLLDVPNEIELLTRLFCLFHGLFIVLLVDKCTACQNHWKSDFGWHRFQKWAYSLALVWGVRGLKSIKRFCPHLMALRSCISTQLSTGKPEQLLSLMFFFFFSGF